MKISVIIPAFNEQDSISQCVLEFKKLFFVSEVIVVDNNS
jgi:glycosyltransferase involved in cell wall biosynthesis